MGCVNSKAPEDDNYELELVEEFRIEMSTPSARLVEKWKTSAPSRYSQLEKSLSEWVRVMTTQLEVPKASGRRHVHITRSYKSERHKLRDEDLVGGCAPLLDALVEYGVMLDGCADLTYEQSRQTSGEDWVAIEIYDVVRF